LTTRGAHLARHLPRWHPDPGSARPGARSRARDAELVDTAERLEGAYHRDARIVALEISDREAILRALEDAPAGLTELRAVLLQEHVGRQREGLV